MEIRWHSAASVAGDVKQKSVILQRGDADVERCGGGGARKGQVPSSGRHGHPSKEQKKYWETDQGSVGPISAGPL